MTFLDDNLAKLAHTRKEIEEQKEAIILRQMELEETDLYKGIQAQKERLGTLALVAAESDKAIRSRALIEYEAYPDNKSINQFVSIAEHTTFEIDQDLAIAWASEHHHKGLKLNLTEIKKVAKAGMEVDGVVLGKENRVKIASDLSGYLADSE